MWNFHFSFQFPRISHPIIDYIHLDLLFINKMSELKGYNNQEIILSNFDFPVENYCPSSQEGQAAGKLHKILLFTMPAWTCSRSKSFGVHVCGIKIRGRQNAQEQMESTFSGLWTDLFKYSLNLTKCIYMPKR